MRTRNLARFLAAVVLFCGCTHLLQAQKPQILPPTTAEQKPTPSSAIPQNVQVAPQLTKEDLEAFFDGFLPIQLQRDDIAGAVVVVVKDGTVLLAKGYGYSDVKQHKPVTVDATLFRPGSISKTFVWTAVMQLYEQGKLDLDRDVNDYLDFKIPAKFGKPITMKNLLTHTPGFEESIQDLFVSKASDMTPLGKYLRTHVPEQIFPPGTTPAYSNYGATLAGYIVQRVSGMPFDDYIEKNIFQPLGMQHSTFRQPLPENLKPLMSQGYNKASQPPREFEFVQAWPCGSLSTTAEDMSHYLIAHLQGEYNGARILKPETARLMHSRLFGLVPELNGMAYGFYEEARNGHRIIGHGGDTQWFHSDMHLMLDDHLGFFISYNSAGKPGFSGRTAVWQKFLNRYFAYTPPASQSVANAAQDMDSVVGTYWSSRRSQGNIVAVIASLDQAQASKNADGTISIDLSKDFAGNPKRFQEIAPMLFREVDGQSRFTLTKDYAGKPIIVSDLPIFVFQPTPARKGQNANLAILIFAVAMFVITLLFWPLNAMLRSHYGYYVELTPQYRRLRFWVRVVCVLDLAFLGCFALWLTSVEENIALLSSNYHAKLHALQVIGALGALGTLLAIGYCLRSWRSEVWFWAKVWNTLLMLACLAYTFYLLNWHMLNFRLNY